jgi:excisionase family DNA binding protein
MGGVNMARSSVLGGATRVEPGPDDRRSAASLSRAVAGVARLIILLPDGQEIELPHALVRILQASADQLSAGHAVTVLASEVVLTPAEVGELLGLSRPFVARLLDQGQLSYEHLPHSRHRVVRLADVLEFQARREEHRRGRRRIAEVVEANELPY